MGDIKQRISLEVDNQGLKVTQQNLVKTFNPMIINRFNKALSTSLTTLSGVSKVLTRLNAQFKIMNGETGDFKKITEEFTKMGKAMEKVEKARAGPTGGGSGGGGGRGGGTRRSVGGALRGFGGGLMSSSPGIGTVVAGLGTFGAVGAAFGGALSQAAGFQGQFLQSQAAQVQAFAGLQGGIGLQQTTGARRAAAQTRFDLGTEGAVRAAGKEAFDEIARGRTGRPRARSRMSQAMRANIAADIKFGSVSPEPTAEEQAREETLLRQSQGAFDRETSRLQTGPVGRARAKARQARALTREGINPNTFGLQALGERFGLDKTQITARAGAFRMMAGTNVINDQGGVDTGIMGRRVAGARLETAMGAEFFGVDQGLSARQFAVGRRTGQGQAQQINQLQTAITTAMSQGIDTSEMNEHLGNLVGFAEKEERRGVAVNQNLLQGITGGFQNLFGMSALRAGRGVTAAAGKLADIGRKGVQSGFDAIALQTVVGAPTGEPLTGEQYSRGLLELQELGRSKKLSPTIFKLLRLGTRMAATSQGEAGQAIGLQRVGAQLGFEFGPREARRMISGGLMSQPYERVKDKMDAVFKESAKRASTAKGFKDTVAGTSGLRADLAKAAALRNQQIKIGGELNDTVVSMQEAGLKMTTVMTELADKGFKTFQDKLGGLTDLLSVFESTWSTSLGLDNGNQSVEPASR